MLQCRELQHNVATTLQGSRRLLQSLETAVIADNSNLQLLRLATPDFASAAELFASLLEGLQQPLVSPSAASSRASTSA